MNTYSKWMMRIAAIYALIGGLIGSDLAGRKDYTVVPTHAHILVVGWLTLFAYGLFYYVFQDKIGMKKTARVHAWASLLGGGLMPLCMLFYYKAENPVTLVAFIVSASILLLAILLFTVLLFFDKELFKRS